MTGQMNWGHLFQEGGPVLILLLLALIVSCVIIVERWLYFRSSRLNSGVILLAVTESLHNGSIQSYRMDEIHRRTPVGHTMSECLNASLEDDPEGVLFEEVKSRSIAEKLPEMEKYLHIIATLGSVSPFVGLFGTVLGIIRAFQSLGVNPAVGAASMGDLNAGIAEALVTTAAGLLVAIPSTIAFNYFRKSVDGMILDMEIGASRLKVLMLRSRGGRHGRL